MRSLKIAFCVLLCVTILSISASVVCAVIAGNVADSFRDYRASVITTLSSLHGQLNSSKHAFTDALARLDGLQDEKTESQFQTEIPTQVEKTEQTEQTESESQTIKQPEASFETTAPSVSFTLREVGGRIGIFDANGAHLRTLNISVATLPRADREQLAIGIQVFSEQELSDLIEDFSG